MEQEANVFTMILGLTTMAFVSLGQFKEHSANFLSFSVFCPCIAMFHLFVIRKGNHRQIRPN